MVGWTRQTSPPSTRQPTGARKVKASPPIMSARSWMLTLRKRQVPSAVPEPCGGSTPRARAEANAATRVALATVDLATARDGLHPQIPGIRGKLLQAREIALAAASVVAGEPIRWDLVHRSGARIVDAANTAEAIGVLLGRDVL